MSASGHTLRDKIQNKDIKNGLRVAKDERESFWIVCAKSYIEFDDFLPHSPELLRFHIFVHQMDRLFHSKSNIVHRAP